MVDFEVGEPDFFACLALHEKVRNAYLLPSRVVADNDFDDVLGIVLNGGPFRNVKAKGRCPMRTGRATYSAQRARVLCAEAASQPVAQVFRHIVGCDGVVRIREGLHLLGESR